MTLVKLIGSQREREIERYIKWERKERRNKKQINQKEGKKEIKYIDLLTPQGT